MIIPVYKNLEFISEFFIERCLPNKGKILVNQGDEVQSFTKIGYSKDTNRELIIPSNYRINRNILKNNNVKVGDMVAYYKNNYIFAPFDGYIEEKGKSKCLIKYQEDYWSLSGVNGVIEKVIPSRSCLIKTSGMLDKAIEVGCEGVIAGSCDRETLVWAKENNFFVGILSGFGRIPTYTKVFYSLKALDGRYSIVREGSCELFVSTSEKKNFLQRPFDTLKNDLNVVILDYPYFGWEGVVTQLESEIVSVRIVRNNEVIKTIPSNIIALP